MYDKQDKYHKIDESYACIFDNFFENFVINYPKEN